MAGLVIMDATYDLYLDLMARCLTDWIYDGVDERARAEGRDWPARAHTMIGLKRLANIRTCVEAVLDDRIQARFQTWNRIQLRNVA